LLLLYLGRHTEARSWLVALCDRTRERGDESDLAFVLQWLSWLETQCGDLTRAQQLAEEGAYVARLTGSQSMLPWLLTQEANVAAHRGEVEQVRQLCAEAAPLVAEYGSRLPFLWIAAALAMTELSIGNAEAAWRACDPLLQVLEGQGLGEPVPMFFLPDALEALVAAGQLDRAEALIGALQRRGRELDRAWASAIAARCRGLLLAARGDIGGALAAFADALAHHERMEMPFALARTLLAKGVVERRARQRARAKASLEQALESFERLGARRFAERTREELRRVGLRPAGHGDLTATERRVAELAAAGRTNREIADALFVSAKTVEANLARVYRKLGIGSRAELGAHMAKSATP
jgi:DNA-binding CsgD family transcriptional regulator